MERDMYRARRFDSARKTRRFAANLLPRRNANIEIRLLALWAKDSREEPSGQNPPEDLAKDTGVEE